MLTIPSVLEARAIEELRREELEEARAIQSVMLPADVLHAGQVTVAYEFQPVETVGGDFLDYFQLPDSSVGFYVGDVSGKGLPAAMYAALAVGILRGIHKTGQSPDKVLSVLNRRLTSRGGLRRHAAILYGLFNPSTSEMTLASAGMPGPLHFSATGCRIIELSGIPPGLFPDSEYESVTVALEPGDSIVCCSDGITEAQNARYEDFGSERLIDICTAGKGLPPADLLARIFSSVHNFTQAIRQHDDMATAIFQLQRSQ
jgi:sigma-B regulation protein RsbU (phosphoserine phosphatase)